MWNQALDRNLFVPNKSSRFVEFSYQSSEIDKLIEYLDYFSDQKNMEDIINLLIITQKALINISINKNIKTALMDVEEEVNTVKSKNSTNLDDFLKSAINYAIASIDYNLKSLGNKEILDYWSRTKEELRVEVGYRK